MIFDDEIKEIGEELSIHEIKTNLVNNVVSKSKEFDELSRRNIHFMRPRYIPVERTTNFFFDFILRKTTTFEEIDLTLISYTS